MDIKILGDWFLFWFVLRFFFGDMLFYLLGGMGWFCWIGVFFWDCGMECCFVFDVVKYVVFGFVIVVEIGKSCI